MPRGRPRGSPNKATKAREEYWAKEGVMPLDYMLSVLRDPEAPEPRRDEMAKAAAPYCHPRLSQVDARHSGKIDVRAWLQSLGEPD